MDVLARLRGRVGKLAHMGRRGSDIISYKRFKKQINVEAFHSSCILSLLPCSPWLTAVINRRDGDYRWLR